MLDSFLIRRTILLLLFCFVIQRIVGERDFNCLNILLNNNYYFDSTRTLDTSIETSKYYYYSFSYRNSFLINTPLPFDLYSPTTLLYFFYISFFFTNNTISVEIGIGLRYSFSFVIFLSLFNPLSQPLFTLAS